MNNALTIIAEKNNLTVDQTANLNKHFDKFQIVIDEWNDKAKAIVVADKSEVDIMKSARNARLFLREKRIALEKTRKDLKEGALRESQAIDGMAKLLKDMITPLEDHLLKQENFVAIELEKEEQALYDLRRPIIVELGLDPANYNLRKMPELDFDILVTSQKKAIEDKKIADEKAEADRIASEKAKAKENERIRLENQKLREERDERNRLADIENKKRNEELAVERAKTKAAEDKAEQERLDKIATEEKLAEEKRLKVNAENQVKYHKEKKVEKLKTADEKLLHARKLLTTIHGRLTETCYICTTSKAMISLGMSEIGGFIDA